VLRFKLETAQRTPPRQGNESAFDNRALEDDSVLSLMKIEQDHQIDASEPDAAGMYDWYYEYDVYRYSEGERTLVARSYTDTSDEAHFLRYEVQAKHLPIAQAGHASSAEHGQGAHSVPRARRLCATRH
jgi:hypothetical protein